MNKNELADAVAGSTGFTKADALRFVDACFGAITTELVNGGQVALAGFGGFSVGTRAARTGLNPQTREKIEIPASRVAKFKPGKALKDAVNVAEVA